MKFKWDKCYWTNSFSDKVVIAWGGNLNYNASSTKKSVKYNRMYGIYPFYAWGSLKDTKAPSATETINKGVEFTFPQKYSTFSDAHAKSGTISIVISDTSFTSRKTNVISQYCHRVWAISSASINISGTPSISASSAYETSDTDKTSTKIKY